MASFPDVLLRGDEQPLQPTEVVYIFAGEDLPPPPTSADSLDVVVALAEAQGHEGDYSIRSVDLRIPEVTFLCLSPFS